MLATIMESRDCRIEIGGGWSPERSNEMAVHLTSKVKKNDGGGSLLIPLLL